MPPAIERTPLALQTWWSISFQEQFFLLVGLLGLAAGRIPSRLLATLALGSAALRVATALMLDGSGLREYAILDCWLHLNLDVMAWGALAWREYDRLGALWRTRRRAVLATSIVLVAAALGVTLRSVWWGNLSQAVLSGVKYAAFALVVRMVCEYDSSHALPMRLLRSRPFALLSRASFEIYLLHALLYRIIEQSGVVRGWRFPLVAVPIALGAGALFHVAVGDPLQQRLRRLLGVSRGERPVAVAVPQSAAALPVA
jgi:peptidoglycan/LPS O-acetylase OafA/YrhL